MKKPRTPSATLTAAEPSRPQRRASRALALGSLLLLALGAQPVAADCSSVTTVTNETQLNDAIAEFNAVATPNCVYTLQFSANIDLAWGTTPINNLRAGTSLVIAGNGKTLDGKNIPGVRGFEIRPSTTVTINELTVRGGKTVGGGVANRGGGIFVDGGHLTLNRSTIAGNASESRGGGISNRGGIVDINDSTISGNTSGRDSAHNISPISGDGGGVYNEGGPMTIRNSTVSGNEARGNMGLGGGISNSHNVTLDSVTITDNSAFTGAGLYYQTLSPSLLTIRNTILAENFGFDCYKGGGGATIVDQGYNLVGDQYPGANNCGFVDGVNNNVLAAAQLEPLADNGGPTQTHALDIDSKAIDAGNTTLATDQRGVTRPAGAAADIGAYESLACEDSAWSVTRKTELDKAIECFNAKATARTYTISIHHGITALTSTTPIDNDTSGVELVIEGNGNSGDWNGDLAPGDARPFLIEAGTKVTINDFSITGGKVKDDQQGGGILNRGDLTLVRCAVTGSTAYWGGGIFNADGGRLTVRDSTIAGNTATNAGGGIYSGGTSNPTSLALTNSTVSGNFVPEASANAGGVEVIGAKATAAIDSATIADNSGGIATASGMKVISGASATLTNTIVADNGPGGDCYFISVGGSTIGGDHNLIEDGAGCASSMSDTIVGQDPLLGALRNNGGPTRTHALLPGSPAIDAGDTTLTTDQRGFSRPSGAADDIGAFEEAQLGTITVVKATYVPTTTDFDFTLAGGNLPAPIAFKLDTSQDDPDAYDTASFDLEAGNYTVTETGTGYVRPISIVCSDANGPIGSFPGNAATIALQVHQDVTCTFTNDHVCDLSRDGYVSKADITLINGRLRGTVPVGTQGDINGDGKITTQDTRGCSLQCSLAGCAGPAPAP